MYQKRGAKYSIKIGFWAFEVPTKTKQSEVPNPIFTEQNAQKHQNNQNNQQTIRRFFKKNTHFCDTFDQKN